MYFSLHRNYVSYLIPMSIFNMAIQVFVVMSSYQSIAQKFKKTGNPKVSVREVQVFCFHANTEDGCVFLVLLQILQTQIW